MDASGAKDNANPVVHSVAAAANQRRGDATEGLSDGQDWWRDSALLSQTASGSRAVQAKGSDVPYISKAGANGGSSLLDDDELFGSAEASGSASASAATPASAADSTRANGSSADAQEATRQIEEIDQQEIFDLVRSISDPEHPLTLEQLAVVNPQHITLTPAGSSSSSNAPSSSYPHILLEFTPTIPHCSMSTLIGLSLRVRLMRALPARYKVDIRVRPGTHQSETSVNKQLNDKERVAAALENQHLLEVVMQALSTAYQRGGKAVQDRSDSGVQVGAEVDAALEQAELLAARLGVTI